MKNQKSILLFLIIFSVLFLAPLLVQAQQGLVPCGGPNKLPCQLCHFFVLFKNIVDFLLRPSPLNSGIPIIPTLAVLMIVISGVMFMFAYLGPGISLPGGGRGGPALLSQAKKLMTSVIMGLIIIYAAWIIVNIFFMGIGVSEWTGLKEGWWQINCPTK
jgi:hypothetical protein